MLVQIYLLEAVSSVWIDISNPYADPSWFCRIYDIEINIVEKRWEYYKLPTYPSEL